MSNHRLPPHSIILFPNTQFCPILSCLRIFLDLSVLTSVMSSYAAKDIPTERKTRVKRERRKMLKKKSPVIDHSPASEGSAASKQGRTYKLFIPSLDPFIPILYRNNKLSAFSNILSWLQWIDQTTLT